jgi:hypothetical protein
MKNIKKLFVLLFVIAIAFSCEDSTLIDDSEDALTGSEDVGGLVTLNNSAIGYVVGNDATYTASGSVYQGKVQTTSISVFKSFTSSATGGTSNKELLTTIPISNTTVGETVSFNFSFTYEDLIQGLTLGGSPLPTDDSELNIGDSWSLSYVATISTGHEHVNAPITKVSVGTRFAGLYRTLDAQYWRIGVLNATASSWPAVTVIESVDATTYRVVEYFGLFAGNTWYFQIDSNDVIYYPDTTPDGAAQLGNGQPFITCQSNPSDFSSVGLPCGSSSNFVERDDVNPNKTSFI